jgi:hypothetical protein
MTSRLQSLREQTQISIARSGAPFRSQPLTSEPLTRVHSGRTISSLNESFSHLDHAQPLQPDRSTGATASLDFSISGGGGALFGGGSDAIIPAHRDGSSAASGSGIVLLPHRADADARSVLLMQELEEMKQLLKAERDARMALERKVAVLSHWKDACDSDVQDCKGRVDTIDQKLHLDMQRLSSRMSEERSKLAAGERAGFRA